MKETAARKAFPATHVPADSGFQILACLGYDAADKTSEEPNMTFKTIHGKAHGKTIELEEDLGVPEGQEVEVQVRMVLPATTPMKQGLAEVYAILGERYDSGHKDTAERHDEHQP